MTAVEAARRAVGSPAMSPIGSGPSCRPGRRSWRRRCAATWCNWPRSSPRAASRSPTARCVSWPTGSPTAPRSPPSPTSPAATSRTTRCGSPPDPGPTAATLAKNTQRQRLRMIRIFFERLIEWDWPDAPRRNPILHGDIPPRPEPLPKFLDDRDAARLMAAARAHPDPRTRLVVEMLARTGLRAGELCDLAADAVTQIGDAHWLRVPVGKLRNDRYIPLHPDLIVLLADWTALNADHIRAQRRLIADHRAPLEGRTVHRIVGRVAKRAGIGHVHPHQLRHTLATQAINRGMRLEAIAALLGHRSMEMTLTYARIADRVVADEYASVHAHIDALYGQIPTGALPADVETAAMTRLRHEAHARMLGNGLCTRPAELDCRMETVCETCAYFATGPEFVPVLLRQRDHARDRHQTDRADLFDTLIERAGTPS